MSHKHREDVRAAVGRKLDSLAGKAAALAVEVRLAVAPAEGRAWADLLALQWSRLASDTLERAVDLDRGRLELVEPAGDELPLIAAIEARGRELVSPTAVKMWPNSSDLPDPAPTHPSPANGSVGLKDLNNGDRNGRDVEPTGRCRPQREMASPDPSPRAGDAPSGFREGGDHSRSGETGIPHRLEVASAVELKDLDAPGGPEWSPIAGRGKDWRTTPIEALTAYGLAEGLIELAAHDCEIAHAGEAWELLETGALTREDIGGLAWRPEEARALELALVALRHEAGDPAPCTGIIPESAVPIHESTGIIPGTPNPIREPDEPAGGEYTPDHPWYYKLGGRVLDVEEIGPASVSRESISAQTKWPAKTPRIETLRRLLALAEEAIGKDVDRYRELVEKGWAAISEYEKSLRPGGEGSSSGLDDALSLKHNHISYEKGRIAAIREMIAESEAFCASIHDPAPEKPKRKRSKAKVPTCRVCGCTDDDCRQCIEKTGERCHWIEPGLCSACHVPIKLDEANDLAPDPAPVEPVRAKTWRDIPLVLMGIDGPDLDHLFACDIDTAGQLADRYAQGFKAGELGTVKVWAALNKIRAGTTDPSPTIRDDANLEWINASQEAHPSPAPAATAKPYTLDDARAEVDAAHSEYAGAVMARYHALGGLDGIIETQRHKGGTSKPKALWRVLDTANGGRRELKPPIEAASEDAARRRARARHKGLRHVAVERIELTTDH